QGYLPSIEFDKITQMSQLVSALYPALCETLRQTNPQGSVQDLTLLANANWQDLSLSDRFSKMRLKAWQDVPGMQDLNGEFWYCLPLGSA
ncbi:hypothetical protein, partial [Escherichia coli]|uniref:YhdP family protein n=1 Tax=Escherichia coli TaxID=562 RepID=UPI003B9E2705